MEITMAEAKQVYRFLQTLDTCEYKGVAPQLDDITADDLSNIASAIYQYIVAEGEHPYA